MNVPFFSIIIPVYNVEMYIGQMIDSVLRQKFTNYELLLIDDGSVDRTSIICDEYFLRYSQFIRVFHLNNQGVSSARNVGIEYARGEFLLFLDSDDIVEKNDMLSQFYQTIKQTSAELVVQGYTIRNLNNIKGCDSICVYPERTYDWFVNQREFVDIFYNGYMFVVWNKIFRKDIINRYHIRFVDQQMEDFRFVLDYMKHIRCVHTIDYCSYCYYKRNNNSLTHKIRSNMLEDYLYIHKMLLSLFPLVERTDIHRLMFPQYYSMVLLYINSDIKNRKEQINLILNNDLVKLSFKQYSSYSLSDYICFSLIRKRYIKLYKCYRRLMSRI